MLSTRQSLTGGALALLAVLFVALVLLSNQLLRGARLDLTEQSLYTLADGTRNILKKLDEPLQLTLYFSDKATAESNRTDVRGLRVYFERVRELLEEMNGVAGGKIRLEVVDPVAYSEAEDRAVAAGVQGLPLGPAGEKIFFGLVGSNSTDGQAAIAFFDPSKETFLEYDIAKLIHDLTTTKKPSVALLSSLNLAPGFDPNSMQMSDGWAAYQQLAQLFEVKALDANNLKSIPADVKVLVLVHPKQLSDDAQYAIDQFVLRGGHLLAFVDPNAETDFASADPSNPMAGMLASKASDLPALFKAWGVEYDAKHVVLDREHALAVSSNPDAPPSRHPGILRFGKADLPQNDVVSANLDTLIVGSAGAFKAAKDSPYQLVPLLQTGSQAMTVPAERVRMSQDPAELLNGFAASGEGYVLAARLQGKFKTAFPNRSGPEHLAEAKDSSEILLVADTDLLSNRYWVRVQNFFGQKLLNAFADNGDWLVNAVDNLAGSSDLISIRGRGTSYRPFTLVEQLKLAADDRFRVKEQELQRELGETERKLVELQSGKSADQKQLLSAEQQRELENFLKRKLQIRKELREVRRQLDADIDTLGAWLKFVNIALLPIAITLGSLLYLAWGSRRAAV
ncbi:Gldg family protein [Methylomonas sp. SURF-1]|uniref:Gldg family protein n=1 Tax=Methylomonas aurea TaxID=2952224 RepID=A0ABT1UF69_9GAMM|nr:Gldg family protein [Methylomonas sp. SURF-1]MCQ8180879.1 Gldg family protein [Methylomonas sp. SURF-1]